MRRYGDRQALPSSSDALLRIALITLSGIIFFSVVRLMTIVEPVCWALNWGGGF